MGEKDARTLWKELIKPTVPGSRKLYELYFIYTFLGVKRGEMLLEVLERFLPVDGKFFLDVGCGAGGLAIAFTKRSSAAVAFDIDPRYLKVAKAWSREEGVKLNLLVASGENMPFRDGTFNFVACSDIIEHLNNPAKMVSEVARVIKKGGIVYLTCPNRISPQIIWKDNHYLLPFFTLLPRRVADIYVRATKRGESNEVFFLPSYSKLVKLFENAGIRLHSWNLEEKMRAFHAALSRLKPNKAGGLIMRAVKFVLKHFYLKWICPVWIFLGKKLNEK
ncbi:MAG: class I SAM-dependent methyltransferase [Candidatus Freyarchaeota archaeon]|nr:class I SAM-dependent methyltransferase [Candidatus Jordarchaeia archaeon]